MSINRNRSEPTCLCCGLKRPQKFALFCDDCMANDPQGCKDRLGFAEYADRYPKPRPRREWWPR